MQGRQWSHVQLLPGSVLPEDHECRSKEGGEVRAIDAIRRSGIGIEPHRSVRDAAVVMERSGSVRWR